MTIIFGALTFGSFNWIKNYSGPYGASDAPTLCFEKEGFFNGGFWNEGAYICGLERDENNKNVHLTDPEDYTIFLQDQMTFVYAKSKVERMVILIVIGAIATVAGLIGTIVYWNHNRVRKA